MKKIILIFMFIFSYSLFGYEDNNYEDYENSLEVGVLIGYPSNVFLQYNIENLYSFRLAGIIMSKVTYEVEFHGMFYLYNELDTGAFYISAIARKLRSNDYKVHTLGLGLGVKYSINRSLHFFVEASENIYRDNSKHLAFIPLANIGLSVSF